MKNIPKNIGFLLQFVIGLNQRKFYLRRLYHEKSFLRKMLSVTMALAMAAGAACSTAAVASAAQTDVVPLTAVQELTNESTISANVYCTENPSRSMQRQAAEQAVTPIP